MRGILNPFNKIIGTLGKKIKTSAKKDGLYNTGNKNPFPQFIFDNKLVGKEIGLDSDNNLFKHAGFFIK